MKGCLIAAVMFVLILLGACAFLLVHQQKQQMMQDEMMAVEQAKEDERKAQMNEVAKHTVRMEEELTALHAENKELRQSLAAANARLAGKNPEPKPADRLTRLEQKVESLAKEVRLLKNNPGR